MAATGPAPKKARPRPHKPTLTFPEQTEPEWFHFEIDGVDYSLPSIHTNLSFGARLAGSTARTRDEQLSTYLTYESDDETRAAVNSLRGTQGSDLGIAWIEFEGATIPE